MMRVFSSLKRGQAPAIQVREPLVRFDAAAAVVISKPADLAGMAPRFVRSLSSEFGVEALGGRVSPVQLDDDSVAIFALGEHVGSDQADELSRRILQLGYTLAEPARYIVAAPVLLAISRGQLTGRSLTGAAGAPSGQSRTALADAFQDVLEWGVRHGASDIHLNVRLHEPESEIKYTILGHYIAPERFHRMPTATLIDMLSVAWMDIRGGNGAVFDLLVEQQGSMSKWVDGQPILLRWASLAADAGPSICLRLLQGAAASRMPGLDQLGYLPDQIHQIERVMLSEGGAVIFAGTVGSGKSTSLASLIAGLPTYRKVITIEDPVEYHIPGAIQNTLARNLDTAAHDAYAAKLRALKRSAMTDVLLGEIRDQETGRAFMDLAGSGVNVYTTVHAPSAALIPGRLSSEFIGVPSDFLAMPGLLKLLVFQVLLPSLCAHCALPATFLAEDRQESDHTDHHGFRSPAQWTLWLDTLQSLYPGSSSEWRIRNAAGCTACRKIGLPQLYGYAGRTVAAEIIEPALAPTTGRSAMDCAMLKARLGGVDPRDVERRFHSFETHSKRLAAAKGRDDCFRKLRAVP